MDAFLGVNQVVFGRVATGIHVSGAAFQLADVGFAVERIAKNLKGQFAALDGLLKENRDGDRA